MPYLPTHALIIEGDDPAVLRREGLLRAAAWLCSETSSPCTCCPGCKKVLAGEHTDLHLIDEGAGNSVKVEQIRALRRKLALRPLEGERCCAVILRAEALTRASQNALLELLEEPPPGARLVLCTAAADMLLPTVRSRCAIERMRGKAYSGEEKAPDKDREAALSWLAAMDDDWERTKCSLSWEKCERGTVRLRLEILLDCLRETMEKQPAEHLWRVAALCRTAWDALERNASVGIVCGILAAGMSEPEHDNTLIYSQ